MEIQMRTFRTLSLVGMAAGILVSAQASAEVWSKASVDLVGVQPDGTAQTYVYLSDTAASPAFTKRFFRVKGANHVEALSVLLSASNNGKKVHFLSDVDSVGPNDVPTISVIYLTTESIAP
jgi:hypothetical protein